MIQLALCDDSQLEREAISLLLGEYAEQLQGPVLQFSAFDRAEPLLEAVADGAEFDIFLLDIVLPGMYGIELARRLREEEGQQGPIIFLTGSREFALEAYSVKALDYLLKPVRRDTLFPALNRVIKLADSEGQPRYTLVRTPQGNRRVLLADIVAVEVKGHVLCYYLTGGETLSSKVLRVSFDKATQSLTARGSFIKPHQSFLVNADHIRSMNRFALQMDNGMEVPISRLRHADVREAWQKHLGNP